MFSVKALPAARLRDFTAHAFRVYCDSYGWTPDVATFERMVAEDEAHYPHSFYLYCEDDRGRVFASAKFTHVRGSGMEFSFQRDFGVDLGSRLSPTMPRLGELELFHGGRVAINEELLPQGVKSADVLHALFEAGIGSILSMYPDRATLVGELDREAALVYRRLLGINVLRAGPTLHGYGAQTYPGVMPNAGLHRYMRRRLGNKAVTTLFGAPAPMRRSA